MFYFPLSYLHQHAALWHKINEFEVEESIDISILGQKRRLQITLEWTRLSSPLHHSLEMFYGGVITSLC